MDVAAGANGAVWAIGTAATVAAAAVVGATAAAVTTAALAAVVLPGTITLSSGAVIGQVTTSLFAAFSLPLAAKAVRLRGTRRRLAQAGVGSPLRPSQQR